MKKVLLFFGIVINLGILFASLVFVFQRLTHRTASPIHVQEQVANSLSQTPAEEAKPESPQVQASSKTVAAAPLPAPKIMRVLASKPPVSNVRRILFSYHNTRAKAVSVRADFTGWKAESMAKDRRNNWTFTASLTPGEYAYIFVVDGKAIRDPFNKRTKRVGTNIVSSKLVAAVNGMTIPSKPAASAPEESTGP